MRRVRDSRSRWRREGRGGGLGAGNHIASLRCVLVNLQLPVAGRWDGERVAREIEEEQQEATQSDRHAGHNEQQRCEEREEAGRMSLLSSESQMQLWNDDCATKTHIRRCESWEFDHVGMPTMR